MENTPSSLYSSLSLEQYLVEYNVENIFATMFEEVAEARPTNIPLFLKQYLEYDYLMTTRQGETQQTQPQTMMTQQLNTQIQQQQQIRTQNQQERRITTPLSPSQQKGFENQALIKGEQQQQQMEQMMQMIQMQSIQLQQLQTQVSMVCDKVARAEEKQTPQTPAAQHHQQHDFTIPTPTLEIKKEEYTTTTPTTTTEDDPTNEGTQQKKEEEESKKVFSHRNHERKSFSEGLQNRDKHSKVFSYIDNLHGNHYEEENANHTTIDADISEAIRRRYSCSVIRRSGISSETIRSLRKVKIPRIPKTDDEYAHLVQATSNNILFRQMDMENRKTIFDAMVERVFEAGKEIIREGADGDNFYVMGKGVAEIFKANPDTGESEKIKEATEGDVFGELALIYGRPRAATVKAKTEVKCWAIDRNTFRQIMMKATVAKRKLYQEFLKKVKPLQELNDYERLRVADALIPCEYRDGDVIIKQGAQGYSFFIIVEGSVSVTKNENGKDCDLGTLKVGNYFGEMALVKDEPRAATVTAIGNVSCVKLDRTAFDKLLGSCVDVLKRDMRLYNEYMTSKI
mmetsp:Transcript_3360/g.4962  ORF Transcript_3360/g.4962 Transcript_3360/m.4962 type:complete len:569 (+) Transcript_3360:149-1855(+)